MLKTKEIIVLLTVFVFNTSALCHRVNSEGYYWRDYTGEIPTDALPGGSDQTGKPIYIGQILHENRLLTTKIYANDNKGYYGLQTKEYSGAENMKILCTQHRERLVWVKTKSDEIHLLTNHDLVSGGHEPGYTMYIGRAVYKSETLVGKVSTGKPENFGLYVTDDGKEINLKSFEILTYNPHVISPSDSCISPSDSCISVTIYK